MTNVCEPTCRTNHAAATKTARPGRLEPQWLRKDVRTATKRKKKPPRQLLKWRMTLKLMWQGSCGVGIANRGLAHACAQKLKKKWFEESFFIQFCCTGMNGKTTRGHSAMILRPWAPFGMPGLARGVPGCHGVAICDPPKQHQTLPGEPGSHSREREGNKSEPKALPKSTCEHRVGVWGKH